MLISRVAVAVALGLVCFALITPSAVRMMLPVALHRVPFLTSTLANLLSIGAMVLALRIIGSVSWPSLARAIGLARPRTATLQCAGLLAVAGLGVAALIGTLRHPIEPLTVLMQGVAFPLAEEVVFRGLAIGVLLREARWRFLPAVVASSAVFGLAHASQGNSLTDSAGIVAITLIGGLLFGWLYRAWDFDLWPAFLLHAGLNLLFELFAFGEDARGTVGWNVLRLALVLAAIALTRRWRPIDPHTTPSHVT